MNAATNEVNLTKKNRQRRVVTPPTPFEQARDELFQQIMRCEVIGAAAEHQAEWFNETMTYFADRYPELKASDVNDLRKLGERFIQPPKAAANEESTQPDPDMTAVAEESNVVVAEVAIEMVDTTVEIEEAEPVAV
jgi:hypothetical protein